jgi:superfamily II DNA/RNA helicase
MGNTRELATQIYDVFKNLSKFKNISSYLCIGGNMDNKYTTDIKKDQVIIGTPGRLADLLSKNIIDASGLKMLIIDEADDILSNSFRIQIKKIFTYVQKSTQVLLLSATIPEEMLGLVKCILREDYVSIRVKDDELKLDGIEQFYVYLNEEDKIDTLIDLYSHLSIGQAIVYVNKVSRAEEIRTTLESKNFSVNVLHGELLQKERKEIMNNFRLGNSRILLTTDVLSRGIDIQQISLVINFDMPKYSQTYIHRIGRSGRYGRNGVAINFITKFDKNIVSNIEKSYNTKIQQLNNETISNLL